MLNQIGSQFLIPIDANGNAIGYWGSQSGETANCDYIQVRPVRVKFNQFNPTAPTGEYSATLRLWSVDENGNLLSIVSEDAYVSLILVDTICEDLSINSQLTDASCSDTNDGQIVLSGSVERFRSYLLCLIAHLPVIVFLVL